MSFEWLYPWSFTQHMKNDGFFFRRSGFLSGMVTFQGLGEISVGYSSCLCCWYFGHDVGRCFSPYASGKLKTQHDACVRPKFNPRSLTVAPEKLPSQKESSLATIHFQWQAVKLWGCIGQWVLGSCKNHHLLLVCSYKNLPKEVFFCVNDWNHDFMLLHQPFSSW